MFTFSGNIVMKFGLKKCGVVILKKAKSVKFDGIHIPKNGYFTWEWIYLPWHSRVGRDKRTRNED